MRGPIAVVLSAALLTSSCGLFAGDGTSPPIPKVDLVGVVNAGNSPGGSALLYRIDPVTGDVSERGWTGTDFVNALAYDPASRRVFGVASVSGGPDDLYTMDLETGAATLVGSVGFDAVWGLAFDGNTRTLYGTTGNKELITIDMKTGAGTLVGKTLKPDGRVLRCFALAFDPYRNVLYGTIPNRFVLIDPGTAACTLFDNSIFEAEVERNGRTRRVTQAVQGLAYDPFARILYGVTDPQASDIDARLLVIDPTTGLGSELRVLPHPMRSLAPIF
ncbi:hypothetical protein ACFL59_03010 [Planctomycetota bacterium]